MIVTFFSRISALAFSALCLPAGTDARVDQSDWPINCMAYLTSSAKKECFEPGCLLAPRLIISEVDGALAATIPDDKRSSPGREFDSKQALRWFPCLRDQAEFGWVTLPNQEVADAVGFEFYKVQDRFEDPRINPVWAKIAWSKIRGARL